MAIGVVHKMSAGLYPITAGVAFGVWVIDLRMLSDGLLVSFAHRSSLGKEMVS
jgi:hypothetical protein